MRRIPGWRCLWAAGLVHATGCEGTSVVLELTAVPGDDPFAGVTSLAAVLSHADVELTRASGSPSDAVVLGEFARPPWIDAVVDGYDTGGEAVARAEQRVFMPERGALCCMALCFCSLPVRDAGACNCGSARCAAECTP